MGSDCEFRAYSPSRRIRPEPLVRGEPQPHAHCDRKKGDSGGEVAIRALGAMMVGRER